MKAIGWPELYIPGRLTPPARRGGEIGSASPALGAAVLEFLVATVEPPVLQSAARASLDHLRDDLSLTCIRQHPWPPIEFENLPVTTQTLADMDADVEVKAHLDVATAIDLPHPANTRLSLNA